MRIEKSGPPYAADGSVDYTESLYFQPSTQCQYLTACSGRPIFSPSGVGS